MEDQTNQAVKIYLEQTSCSEDDVLTGIRKHSQEMGLPDIHVPAHVGKFLYLLAKIQGAKRILEIGTLGGYSTVWLARALPSDGHLLSIDINPKHLELAKTHLEQANLSHSVTLYEGSAIDWLQEFIIAQLDPFDLIFIDADKMHNQQYLDLSLQLARPGTLIVVDNLIPKGEIIGKPCNGEAIAVYQFNHYFSQHPLLETVFMPTIVGQQARLDSIGLSRVKNPLE